jgi:hypothetical protein
MNSAKMMAEEASTHSGKLAWLFYPQKQSNVSLNVRLRKADVFRLLGRHG